MVPVARFQGSRLASGHAPSPYQHTQSSNQRPSKVARTSSEATIGAALVEAENELGKEVHFSLDGQLYEFLLLFCNFHLVLHLRYADCSVM